MALNNNELIEKIFWVQSQLQLLHWREPKSGFRHQIIGNFYKELTETLDSLIEVIAGTFSREHIILGETLYKVSNDTDIKIVVDDIINILYDFRKIYAEYPAIINVLDDSLTISYKYKYLLELE